jgi:acyl-CoA synthetase (AMP-forming)/AMP-acid ligase II
MGSGDGEIIVYGPNVMQGYHNNPEATKEVMTEDGGFRTGDRDAVWTRMGYLYITGRIKEQYKLVNGKYVFPAALEEEIRNTPKNCPGGRTFLRGQRHADPNPETQTPQGGRTLWQSN